MPQAPMLQHYKTGPFHYSLGLLTMRTGHLQFCAQWLLTLPRKALQCHSTNHSHPENR
jgi:hypothetical protein